MLLHKAVGQATFRLITTLFKPFVVSAASAVLVEQPFPQQQLILEFFSQPTRHPGTQASSASC